jgi:thiamine-phosphate pyrophosphorylase
VVVTDREAAATAGHTVVDAVRAALEGGAPAILLRDKDRPIADRRRLGEAIAPLVRTAGAQLWVTADLALAGDLDADGLHLPGDIARPPGWDAAISRSVHDRGQLERARREGAAHAYAAPVALTTSKPGYGPALGVSGLRRLVADAAGLPLLALGGVGPDNVPAWRAAGAAGIAVMGGVIGAADPADAVRGLLSAWQDAEQRPGTTPPPPPPNPGPEPDPDPDPTDRSSEHR